MQQNYFILLCLKHFLLIYTSHLYLRFKRKADCAIFNFHTNVEQVQLSAQTLNCRWAGKGIPQANLCPLKLLVYYIYTVKMKIVGLHSPSKEVMAYSNPQYERVKPKCSSTTILYKCVYSDLTEAVLDALRWGDPRRGRKERWAPKRPAHRERWDIWAGHPDVVFGPVACVTVLPACHPPDGQPVEPTAVGPRRRR